MGSGWILWGLDVGAQDLQDMSHNGGFTEVSQAWNKTRRAPLGGGVQIAIVTAGEKIGPRSPWQIFMFFKKCRKVPVNPDAEEVMCVRVPSKEEIETNVSIVMPDAVSAPL